MLCWSHSKDWKATVLSGCWPCLPSLSSALGFKEKQGKVFQRFPGWVTVFLSVCGAWIVWLALFVCFALYTGVLKSQQCKRCEQTSPNCSSAETQPALVTKTNQLLYWCDLIRVPVLTSGFWYLQRQNFKNGVFKVTLHNILFFFLLCNCTICQYNIKWWFDKKKVGRISFHN